MNRNGDDLKPNSHLSKIGKQIANHWLALLLLLCAVSAQQPAVAQAADPGRAAASATPAASAAGAVAAKTVMVLQVRDAIGPASAEYIISNMAKAAARGLPLVMIELDTPGGLDTSMRQIIQAILSSPVPIAVYVSPQGARAASAGTYIMYAAHVAAMAPNTTLGAATPVAIGMPGSQRKPAGEDKPPPSDGTAKDKPTKDKSAQDPPAKDKDKATPLPLTDPMTAKQVHDASAYIRGLAQQRGRNAEWAERAVREAVSLTATEALRDKVIDIVAVDVPDLLAQVEGRTVRVRGLEVKLAVRGNATERVLPDWRQRLLSVIANPSFALILMMVGIYGLIFEFSSPGFGLPGTVGAICLLLALFALQLLPVNYAGLALILLAMALFTAEILSPTFGVLGVGGIVAFIAGGLLLFDRDIPGMGVPLPLILGLAASSAGVMLLAGGMALRSRRRPVVSGREDMIGAPGQVLVVEDGQAWAHVHGERWKVTGEQLQPGQRVRVVALDGLTLRVEPADNSISKGG